MRDLKSLLRHWRRVQMTKSTDPWQVKWEREEKKKERSEIVHTINNVRSTLSIKQRPRERNDLCVVSWNENFVFILYTKKSVRSFFFFNSSSAAFFFFFFFFFTRIHSCSFFFHRTSTNSSKPQQQYTLVFFLLSVFFLYWSIRMLLLTDVRRPTPAHMCDFFCVENLKKILSLSLFALALSSLLYLMRSTVVKMFSSVRFVRIESLFLFIFDLFFCSWAFPNHHQTWPPKSSFDVWTTLPRSIYFKINFLVSMTPT